jgi:hypothetical protein
MPSIVISYRRAESAGSAGRIFDNLISYFGNQNVFMDIDRLPLGSDYRQQIADILSRAGVLLVIIGHRWLGDVGRKPIDEENDLVRIEIETAIRNNIPIIPVTVDYAKMPSSEELPQSIKELAFRNAAEVSPGHDFHVHMNRLIRSVEAILLPDENQRSQSSTSRETKRDVLENKIIPALEAAIISKPRLINTGILGVISGFCSYVAFEYGHQYTPQFLTFSFLATFGWKPPGSNEFIRTTLLPGIFFACVICEVLYQFGTRRWRPMLLASFAISVVSWIIAVDASMYLFFLLDGGFSVSKPVVPIADPGVRHSANLALSGIAGGFVGGLGINVAAVATVSTFRILQSYVRIVLAGSLLGSLLFVNSLVLFVCWQVTIAICLGQELQRFRRDEISQPRS